MQVFNGKVAVITGAASGIGLAIAERCANQKVKIVLADIDSRYLQRAEKTFKSRGVETLSVLANVAKEQDIRNLANKTLDYFGEIHILFNNAGVCTGSLILNSTVADWKWIIDVNLWSMIYGVNIFVPIMLKQNNDCYIVNTASMARG